jgi:tripartite-type tricarboxylate transporter receptor subunit TctC
MPARFSRNPAGVCFAALLTAAAFHCGNARAAAYPERPLRLIIAQAPGGNADVIGRALAEGLSLALRQQVVVDNRGGASGIVATELVVRAVPDGYTLLLVPSSFGVNPAVYPRLPYDELRDLAPIMLVASAPNILVVGPALAIKSVEELVRTAKAKPGQLTYGSSGNAGSTHLAAELLKLMAGIDMVHVPYKGASAALIDLISGRISLMFASMPSAITHVRSGRLRAVAVTSAKRAAAAPDLPTVAESGYPGFETSAWQGLLAPAATPRNVIDRLHGAALEAIARPLMRERLAADGAEAVGSTPQALSVFVKSEIAKWSQVVRAAGIRAE